MWSSHDERREAFRIETQAQLDYQLVVDWAQAPSLLELEKTHNPQGRNFQHLASYDHHLQTILNKMENLEPLQSQYLRILNHKISLLTSMIAYKAPLDEGSALLQDLSLSETGLAFWQKDPLEKQQVLQLRLKMGPRANTFFFYGQVVYALKQQNFSQYKIGVSFLELIPGARRALNHFIMQSQMTRKDLDTPPPAI